MKNFKLNKFNFTNCDYFAYILILVGVIFRLLPHPANFTPIGAIALFSGAKLSRSRALFIAITAMLISDIFLGFHTTMPYVYGSFILIIFLGSWLKNHFNILNTALTAISGSLIFFVITNFGVWLHFNLYPHTISGIIACYVAAIPFYRNTLAGDLIYSTVFFGVFELVRFYLSHHLKSQLINNS